MKAVRNLVFPLTITLIFIFLALAGCSELLSASTPYQIPTETATPLPTATPVWFPPTATPTLFVAPTTQPTANLLDGVGSLILSDNFADTTAWQAGEKASGSMEYSINRLTLAIKQPQGNLFSFRFSPTLQNAYVEITTSISLCAGNDSYGLLYRASSIQYFYRVLINCNGLIRLERIRNGVVNVLQDWTISSQLSAGAPLSIKLGVWMKGTTFRVFINKAFQFEASDDAFSSGWLGVFARSAGNTSVTVNFNDLQVFNLSSASTTSVPTLLVTP
jgi:hypothetical protein